MHPHGDSARATRAIPLVSRPSRDGARAVTLARRCRLTRTPPMHERRWRRERSLGDTRRRPAIRAIYNVEVDRPHQHVRPGSADAGRTARMAGRALRCVLRRRRHPARASPMSWSASRRCRRTRNAPRTGRPWRIRCTCRGSTAAWASARALMHHVIDVARDSGFHSIVARIEASSEASRGAARIGRLRSGRRRTRGRAQVQPMARRRHHAVDALIAPPATPSTGAHGHA